MFGEGDERKGLNRRIGLLKPCKISADDQQAWTRTVRRSIGKLRLRGSCEVSNGRTKLETHNRPQAQNAPEFVDARRCPRFKVEVAIRIYPRNSPVIRGRTVDISESGISAMLQVEVPIGEVVRLEFSLDFGSVELHATVRQRTAFRYGFQFVDLGEARDVIRRSCSGLAMQQSSKMGQMS